MGRAEQQTEEALRNLEREGYDLPFIWPDIEEARGYSHEQVIASLRRCVAINADAGYGRQTKQGIYTGRWWWVPNTGNSAAFGDMALWTAYYNTDSAGNWHDDWPIDFSWYQPYGGWYDLPRPTRRDTRQYRGTYNLHGVNVDLNWRDDAWQGEDELDAEGLIALLESMTPDQRNRAYKAGLKQAIIDIFNPPADAPQPLTDEAWNHYVKDKLASLASSGGGGEGDHTHPVPEHGHSPSGVVDV